MLLDWSALYSTFTFAMTVVVNKLTSEPQAAAGTGETGRRGRPVPPRHTGTHLAECLGPQYRRIFTSNTEASALGRGMGAYSPQYTNRAEQRLCRKYQVSPPLLVLPVNTRPLPPPASAGTRAGSSVCGTTLVPTRPRRRKWHFCVAGVFKSVLDVIYTINQYDDDV